MPQRSAPVPPQGTRLAAPARLGAPRREAGPLWAPSHCLWELTAPRSHPSPPPLTARPGRDHEAQEANPNPNPKLTLTLTLGNPNPNQEGIMKLKKLLDAGAITESEFEAKKTELLHRL